MLRSPNAALFDLDGVLVDTTRLDQRLHELIGSESVEVLSGAEELVRTLADRDMPSLEESHVISSLTR